MASIVEYKGVGRWYGQKAAVKDLNLQLQEGELFALLGHNGAGKTTSIKMLVGLLQPQAGTIRVGGHDVVQATRQAVSLLGYVPDQPFLYDKLTGREFLNFVARMYGFSAADAKAQVEQEVARFGLSPFIDDLCESYSHGMKQRTVFAAALLHHPRVLVVDEPMVGLDPHSIRLVKDLLRAEVQQGMCVLMSTHTLSAAEEIADRIGVMRRGELLFSGTVDQLREQHAGADLSLERLYLRMVEQAPEEQSSEELASDPPMSGNPTPKDPTPPISSEKTSA